MPRQRSKKLSAGRETAKDPIPELEQESGLYESYNEDLPMLEKASDEEELDRLVFGDEMEFKVHLGHGTDVGQLADSDGSGGEESNHGEGEGLENVDDADVSSRTIDLKVCI